MIQDHEIRKLKARLEKFGVDGTMTISGKHMKEFLESYNCEHHEKMVSEHEDKIAVLKRVINRLRDKMKKINFMIEEEL